MKKFKDLLVGYTYTVISYRAVKTPHGDSYILTCRNNYNYDDEFEMFSTKGLASYIRARPYLVKYTFKFTVRHTYDYRHAEMDEAARPT